VLKRLKADSVGAEKNGTGLEAMIYRPHVKMGEWDAVGP
jgi:hypothetical protein